MQPEFVVGVGVLLFGLLLVVALVWFKNTLAGGPGRKVSLVSVGLFIGALGCIAALNNPKTMEPRDAALLTIFAVIPICVVVASTFAVSFLEPLLMASGLFLIPLLGDFMPNLSGPRNPWRTPPAEIGPVFSVLQSPTVRRSAPGRASSSRCTKPILSCVPDAPDQCASSPSLNSRQ